MKKIFGTLNLFEVSNNFEDYLSSYSTINVNFVSPLPKILFWKMPNFKSIMYMKAIKRILLFYLLLFLLFIIKWSPLMLKKYPILGTIAWKICCYCWENNNFPAEWKNSTTILIHKKGNTGDTSNFRPITLEPILSELMTSHMQNKIFTFVVKNNSVETNIQKGFWSNISNKHIEHTELLTNILKHAKNKQWQLVVTVFDLKNAFGEVHHNLIKNLLTLIWVRGVGIFTPIPPVHGSCAPLSPPYPAL